jgi:hypothetical protein
MHKLTLVVVAASVLIPGSAAHATDRSRHGSGYRAGAHVSPNSPPPLKIGGCTIALPATHATVEAEIANAADFCELVSQALADDVFHAPVIVTPGRLWHYADAALSCRLRFGHTAYRITIRNAPGACRWATRVSTGWHREESAPGYAP